ncbi:hypothetical protein Aab01nite_75610 [Paractinoplanes abujensis]|uniref:Secreted protein n=1 Tax=Paractinoplanes abujensis TaxID=882441 RepID=A0A7W7CV44_9ACTN|nr:hypothetical protein [Actinoplanes abujensis]MBB4695234.1 hypothetical protein [Actinoplanes abujensis]GID23971.1 hypothetical protein Aab01nite_75610 [Actinoplanes abujensis]
MSGHGRTAILRRLLAVVAVAAATLSMTSAPAVAASAFEFDHTVSATWSGADGCIPEGYGALGCFQHDGDIFRVQDTARDGHSAAIYWHNYLPGSSTLYRWGSCVNNDGYLTIGKCNKNFREGSTIKFKTCLYDDNAVTIPSNVANYYDCTTVWTVIA